MSAARRRRYGRLPGMLLAALAVAVPAAGQTDPQTRDLLQEERRYHQQQGAEAAAASPQAPEPVDEAEARRREVEALLAEADRLVRDRNYASRSTPHYRVQTDDPRIDLAAAADLLESFHGFFEGFWAPRTALRPHPEAGRFFLFYSYFKYNQLFTGRPRFDTFRTTGHYRPFYDVVVLHTDPADPTTLADALVHEAAHQLISQRLLGGPHRPLPWLEEGLASYFGYTRRGREGRFEAGAIGGKGVSLLSTTPRNAEGDADRIAADLRRSLRRDGEPILPGLVEMDAAGFYGPGVEARYAAAWMLVHYLFHGEGGGLAGGFVGYLREDAAAGVHPGRLWQHLGRDPAQVEEGFRAHLRDPGGAARRGSRRPHGGS